VWSAQLMFERQEQGTTAPIARVTISRLGSRPALSEPQAAYLRGAYLKTPPTARAHLEVSSLVEEKVLWLEVAVADALGVAVPAWRNAQGGGGHSTWHDGTRHAESTGGRSVGPNTRARVCGGGGLLSSSFASRSRGSSCATLLGHNAHPLKR